MTVHRSDGSGTTFDFTDYLSKVRADFKSKVGSSTTVNWPGGLGGRGNAGVAGEVKQNANSIGYVELTYAAQNKIGIGLVKNKAGAWPQPSFGAVTAAANAALPTMPDDLRVSIVNPDAQEAWPISTFTWLPVVYGKIASLNTNRDRSLNPARVHLMHSRFFVRRTSSRPLIRDSSARYIAWLHSLAPRVHREADAVWQLRKE